MDFRSQGRRRRGCRTRRSAARRAQGDAARARGGRAENEAAARPAACRSRVVSSSEPMDFEFSEQHELLRQSVRDYCAREIRPHAREWDESERFPLEIVPRLAELGLLGIRVPEAYGGAGPAGTADPTSPAA